jgi:hypothetical protein
LHVRTALAEYRQSSATAIEVFWEQGHLAKRSEGRFRFLCPHCREMFATVNPRNKLAHCFGFNKNLNNIDLLMTLGYDFKTAVSILLRMYDQHRSRLPKVSNPLRRICQTTPSIHPQASCYHAYTSSPGQPRRILPLQFAQQFGKRSVLRPESLQL